MHNCLPYLDAAQQFFYISGEAEGSLMEARGVVARVQFSRKPSLCVQIMYWMILF